MASTGRISNASTGAATGRRPVIGITGAPMRGEAGRTVGGVVAVADVDGRRRAEAHQSLLNHELSHR